MSDAGPTQSQLSVQQRALLALRKAHARIDALERAKSEPLAIISAACRFPGGASTPDAYWQLLRSGTDAITKVPAGRWDVNTCGGPDPGAPDETMVRRGGFLRGVDRFDPQFFGISPREAVSMDPQQRLVLELGWEAIERAGLAPDKLTGSLTGVFLGASTYDYSMLGFRALGVRQDADLYNLTGGAPNMIAGRLSYTLGLQGPSMVVDTACSSALVAVHLACQSLRAGECDLALAGGVSLMLAPDLSIALARAHALAPDGRCKTFDAAADGYARGEGCGIVVLRRLSDALARGDPILALIRGSAVTQDGRSGGLTAPNGLAQRAVIRKALADAHVAPAQVGYVEAHGTGTSLGDPIEVQALAAALGEERAAGDRVQIGAVKTNIGHLEAAAGVAGLLKTVLVLQHGEIPSNLHFHTPNPYIPWDELPVSIPTRLIPWRADDGPRIAGVSAFGFSGTNAHVILEEARNVPPPAADTAERPLQLLCVSAKSERALRDLARNYARYLTETPSVSLADVTHTANSGRAHFSCRASLIARSLPEMRSKLGDLADAPAFGAGPDGVRSGDVARTAQAGRPLIAFLCTGQGAQYPGMGQQLYKTMPVFRAALDECDELLRPHLGQSLLPVLYPGTEEATPLDHTTYTQPALFALEYALAQVWRSWGIVPSAVLGHSAGEYVAACLAGVFSLADGLRLIAERGRLMGDLARNGAMAAVLASEEEIAETIAPYRHVLAIAAVNGPHNTVISGDAAAVQEASAELRAQRIRVMPLPVSHAFHSPLMDPVLDTLERLAAPVAFAEPQIDFISNLTGERLEPGTTLDPGYLRRHAREAVRFQDGMAGLQKLGYCVFVELGPSPVLLAMGRQCAPEGAALWLPSLRKNRDDWQSMLESLGELYVQGVAIDWENFDRDFACRRTVLPTYPFQRQRYWAVDHAVPPALGDGHEPHGPADSAPDNGHPASARAFENWLYRVEWQPRQAIGPGQPAGHWLVLADRGSVGQELAQLLEARGASIRVVFADTWAQSPADTLSALPPCRGIVHLWALDATPAGATTAASLQEDQQRHCASVLRIVRTLAAAELADPPRLWIVTRGTQQAGSPSVPAAIAQAPLWGLGRVIAVEHPEFWGGLIDLAPAAEDGEVTRVLEEICAAAGVPPPHRGQPDALANEGHIAREDQVAFRGRQRYAARIARADDVARQPAPLHPDATYAITGGMGGLGSAIASWMAQRGARHIALVSRSGTAGSEIVRILEQQGAQVRAIQADVSRADQLARALDVIGASMPPLRGVIHAAGVLDDGLLAQQDWARFEQVMTPKIEGAWNLHTLTQTLPLDFFVLFSSAASLLGSPGQGNYAAGNAFLDALAHYRREIGLPALTINWGPWGGAGMAAITSGRDRRRWADSGIELIPPEQGPLAMASLLGGPASQVAVLRLDWAQFARAIADDGCAGISPLLTEWIEEARRLTPSTQARPQSRPPCIEQFIALEPSQRPGFLRDTLRRRAGHILGMAPVDLPAGRNLLELGMDSLMTMELVRFIKQDFQLALYPREFYEHPTIDALAAYLDTELAKAQQGRAAQPAAPTAHPRPAPAVTARPADPRPHAGSQRATPGSEATTPSPSGMVFLLSCPRSGSTLLRVMLAGHPRLFCPPELHLLAFTTLAHQRQELDRSFLHEGLQRALMELRHCDAAESSALLETWIAENLSSQEVYTRLQKMAAPRLLVDKSPSYAWSMDVLRRAEELFTDARYLCLVRHPYAAIESYARNRMHKLIDAADDDPFLVAEQTWVQTNQNMLDFLQQVDPQRQHIVRYEDLVHQPEETAGGICAFLGIPPDPAVLRPYEGERMTDGIHSQSLSIGDPNFLSHDRIETGLGDAWKKITLPRPLGTAATRLAAQFRYPLPEPAPSVPAGSVPASGGLPASEPEGGHRQPATAARPAAAVAREFRIQAHGLRLCVNAWGPQDGPAIVFLHGILDHGMAWEEVAAPLAARGYHVIAPDQRGHGCSAHAAIGGYHLINYMADLDVVLSGLGGRNALPARPPVLVGHSMGAGIAAAFAGLRPDRASALVLIEGVMPGEPPEHQFADLLSLRLQSLADTPQQPVLPDTDTAAQRLRQAMPALSHDWARRMAERITQPCGDGVRWRWDAALLTRSDLTYDTLSFTPARYRALLSRITAPVTLIYGQAGDPRLAELREALPQAAVEIVHGGHNLHIDAPAVLAETIARSAAKACAEPGQ